MKTGIARTLSWIFHPSVLPTLFIIIFFPHGPFSGPGHVPNANLIVYLFIFLFTFLFPVATVILLNLWNMVGSLYLKTAEERRLPFLATAIFYILAYYLMKKNHLPELFNLVMLGASLSVLLACFVNYQWKISIHMIGLGGISGALLGLGNHLGSDLFFPFVITILLSGLIGTARLSLSSHTPAQIYAGFSLGFACQFLVLLLL